jgi:hypothetical protein
MDVMIFKNIFAEKIGVFAQNKAKLSKNWIIKLVSEKNTIFFAEKWQKSQKIVIIIHMFVKNLQNLAKPILCQNYCKKLLKDEG